MPQLRRKTDSDTAKRTPIWVDGQQQPKFKPGPWVVVGHAMARRWVAPRLDQTSARLADLASQIAGGRFQPRLGWLGRAQRLVPSRATVTAGIAGLAARMSEARTILVPLPQTTQPLAYPNLIRPSAAITPLRPYRPIAADKLLLDLSEADPAMEAIRAMIKTDPENAAAHPHAAPAAKVTNLEAAARFRAIEPAAPPRPTRAMRLAAHAIAWTSLALAMPVGLVQATMYHLNGGDLTDWD